jgi:hypothetical protein
MHLLTGALSLMAAGVEDMSILGYGCQGDADNFSSGYIHALVGGGPILVVGVRCHKHLGLDEPSHRVDFNIQRLMVCALGVW